MSVLGIITLSSRLETPEIIAQETVIMAIELGRRLACGWLPVLFKGKY